MKIFAKNIKHLTDARYFAAWGASWMCYALGSLSLSEISAIKEWVEGPKHIINIIGLDASEAAAILSTGVLDGYLTDNIDDCNRIKNLVSVPLDVFLQTDSKNTNSEIISLVSVHPSDIGNFENAICDISGKPHEIQAFVEKQNPLGLVLEGSDEEEVGLKTFDELDEILELLEDQLS